MWKSIKKFFKWIADHTGISWILGKLGWKNHHSTNQEQEEDFDFLNSYVFLDELQSKAPAKSKNASLKVIDGKIKLFTSAENYEALQKNKRGDGAVIDDEFYLNITKDDKQLYITGRYDSKMTMKSGNIRLSINSVGTLDGKEVYGDNEPEKMKGLLDLSHNKMYISIDLNISKVIAKSDQPMEKQVQEKQFECNESISDLTLRIEKLNGNSGTFLCKKSRLIDGKKSQDNSVIANNVVIPEGAELKFSPESSDFLSRESLERDVLFYKTVPNSALCQSREEALAADQSVNI